MSQVTEKGPKSPQMNMTPMIDVTFQLIIFFMLVNTISSTETVEMIVPKIWKPQVKELEEEQRITVNVALKPDPGKGQQRPLDENTFTYGNEVAFVQISLDKYETHELDRLTEDLKKVKEQRERSGKELQLVLRADGGLPYEQLQPIMQHITMAGIETVNIVAFMEDEGPPAAPHQ